jgi:hypothetical protein
LNYCWVGTQGLVRSWDKSQYQLELKFRPVSEYVVNLSEHKLHEEQILVITFASTCRYESQGIIDFE